MAGKFPFQNICTCNPAYQQFINHKDIHITPFKLIKFTINHMFRYADLHDHRKFKHGPSCILEMVWNESAFPQHGGTLSPPHPHFDLGSKPWWPASFKTQHIDLFINWFQYNIHVLYRRYIKIVYGGTLRIYVSVDRAQPEEPIWKVGGDGPLIV
jgi:hypothetical protein